MSDRDPYDLRARYPCFRILVIGWTSTGKTWTALFHRVSNTTEDRERAFKGLKINSASDICYWLESSSWRNSSYYGYLLVCLTLGIQRGIHIHPSTAFIFHNSPGFETSDGKQLLEKSCRLWAVKQNKWSATCNLVGWANSAYILFTDV